ncbi:hypothetical protein SK069_01025 [Patulibacter brassicae]|jgi:hypothetical protein|uniref:Uncharacterized protein n=1 Tax=Patulibacter brassicae TaxID=1705717 RepID=A0ABU4VEE8_9ACTN|nr:hypothetical protein [Patulibacter brassicae]MDX8150162.1 hypothetical protein [Patulibacter brassicae]
MSPHPPKLRIRALVAGAVLALALGLTAVAPAGADAATYRTQYFWTPYVPTPVSEPSSPGLQRVAASDTTYFIRYAKARVRRSGKYLYVQKRSFKKVKARVVVGKTRQVPVSATLGSDAQVLRKIDRGGSTTYELMPIIGIPGFVKDAAKFIAKKTFNASRDCLISGAGAVAGQGALAKVPAFVAATTPQGRGAAVLGACVSGAVVSLFH